MRSLLPTSYWQYGDYVKTKNENTWEKENVSLKTCVIPHVVRKMSEKLSHKMLFNAIGQVCQVEYDFLLPNMCQKTHMSQKIKHSTWSPTHTLFILMKNLI